MVYVQMRFKKKNDVDMYQSLRYIWPVFCLVQRMYTIFCVNRNYYIRFLSPVFLAFVWEMEKENEKERWTKRDGNTAISIAIWYNSEFRVFIFCFN